MGDDRGRRATGGSGWLADRGRGSTAVTWYPTELSAGLLARLFILTLGDGSGCIAPVERRRMRIWPRRHIDRSRSYRSIPYDAVEGADESGRRTVPAPCAHTTPVH